MISLRMMSVPKSPRSPLLTTACSWTRIITRLLLLVLLLTALLMTSVVDAREVNVLPIAWLSQNGLLTDTEQYFASFMLLPIAVKHFNERDNAIIPDLSSRTRDCNATIRIFEGYIRDEKGLQSVAMGHLVEAVSKFDKLDIIHGPTQSDVAQTISMTAGALHIPVLSHTATANMLSDKTTFPTFFRLVPSDTQVVEKIADLLVYFKYKKVGVIHTSDAYGISFRKALAESCAHRRIQISSVFYDPARQGEDLQAQVKSSLGMLVKQNISVIIKHVLLASHELAIAKAAFDLKWIKHKLYIGRRSALRELSTGDAFAREFARGQLAVLPSYDDRNPIYERLLRYMPGINVSFVNQFLPSNSTGLKPGVKYQLPNDFFSRTQSLEGMRFNAAMYDSIIALGLAACEASVILDETMSLMRPRKALFEGLKKISFSGVSGRVQFDENQDRDSSAISFGLENLVDNGTHLIRVIVGSTASNAQWNITKPIMFSDGTSTPPPDVVRGEAVLDYLPLEAKIYGWIESGIGMLFGLFTLVRLICERFVRSNRHRRHKQQYAPRVQEANSSEIMLMNVAGVDSNKNNFGGTLNLHSDLFCLKFTLALATTALASSILPLTIESNVSCKLFPWLFVMSLGVILLCLILCAIQSEVLWSELVSCSVVENGSLRQSEQEMMSKLDQLTLTSTSASNCCSPSAWLYRILFCGQQRLLRVRMQGKQQKQQSRPAIVTTTSSSLMSKEKACFLLVVTLTSYFLFSLMLAGLIVTQILVPLEWTNMVLKRDEYAVPIVSSMGCMVAYLASSNNNDDSIEFDKQNQSSSSSRSTTVGEAREWIMIVFIVLVISVGLLALLALFTSTWLKTHSKDDGASSKMTTLASLCVFQVFFVGLPTAATVWYAALSRFMVLSSVAFATCMIVFTTMFWARFCCCCLQRRWRLRPTQLPDPNLSSSFHNNLNNNLQVIRQLRLVEIAQEKEANLKRRGLSNNNNNEYNSSSQRLLLLLERRMAGESIQNDEEEDDVANQQRGITPGMRRRVPYSDEEDAKTTVHSNNTHSSEGEGFRATSVGYSSRLIQQQERGSPSNHRRTSSVFHDEEIPVLGGNVVDNNNDESARSASSVHSGSTGAGAIIDYPKDDGPRQYANASHSLGVVKRKTTMLDPTSLERTKSLPSFVNLKELQASLSQPTVIISNVPPLVAVPSTLASIVTRNQEDIEQPMLIIASPPDSLARTTTTTSSNSTSVSATTTTTTTISPPSQTPADNNLNDNNGNSEEQGEGESTMALDLA